MSILTNLSQYDSIRQDFFEDIFDDIIPHGKNSSEA